MAYLVTNPTEVVDAMAAAHRVRTYKEFMGEVYPDATWDGKRYHAPCDDYEDPMSGRTFMAGEFLPTSRDYEEMVRATYPSRFPVMAVSPAGEAHRYEGTKAQLTAAKAVLKRQTKEFLEPVSRHVGVVGGRIDAMLRVLSCFERQGFYGTTYIFTLLDAENNVHRYIGTKDIRGKADAAGNISAKFTVLDHTEYGGVAQTNIGRPSFPRAR